MIVGVDIGTQSLKAVAVDERLVIRGQASVAYQPVFPRPGWAEQDPRLWEQALGPAIGGALESAGTARGAVRSLGICGQLDGCVATREDGAAIGNCIVWMDRRAAAEISDVPAGEVLERAGLVLDASHMAAKIRWQKRHLPAASGAVRFHQPVSWLVARLTGEQVFDHGLASTTMLYDLARASLDPGLLGRFEIERDELPDLGQAAQPAGVLHARGAALTGLPPGTPVAVGTGDDFSNVLGAGVVRGGRVVCTLGTAEVVGAVHEAPTIDRQALVETHGFAGGRFLIENPGWLCGGALRWLESTCRLDGVSEIDALAEAVPVGAEGLTFLPALSGAMSPEWIASARGCFYGLTPAHGSAHLARAVLEGCAFAMRDVVDRLRAMGVGCESVVLLGGGARSAVWAQMRADLVALPVYRPAVSDASPLGAALLGAVAAGLAPDIETAAGLAGGDGDWVDPRAGNRDASEEAYHRYRALFDALRPMYRSERGALR